MYYRTTIALFVVTAVLLAWIFAYERHIDDSIASRAKALRIFDFGKEEPTRISIDGAEGKIVIRKSKDGPWQMTEPIRDRADQEQVRRLLEIASKLKRIDTISASEIRKEEAKPGDLGFGDQRVTLTFSRGERDIQSAVIGGRFSALEAVGVMKKGEWGKEPVDVVFSDIRDIIEQEVDLLRDDRVFDMALGDVRRFKFVSDGISLTMRRYPDSESPDWIITVPLESRGDKLAIENRVNELMNLEILEYIDNPTAEITGAFTDSMKHIEVRRRGQPGALRMDIADPPAGAAEGHYLARVADRSPVFHIPKKSVDAYFTVNPNDVRDRRLANFKRDAVSGLSIEAPRLPGAPSTSLVRAEREGWFVVDGEERVPANSQGAMEFIAAMNRENVLRFVPDGAARLKKFGLEQPGFKITVTSLFRVSNPDDPAAPAVLQETARTLSVGHGRYAKFDDQPFVFELDPGFAESINPYPIEWRALDLLRFNPIDVSKVTVQYPSAPNLELVYEVPGGRMNAVLDGRDVTPFLLQGEAARFMKTLSNLRADRWSHAVQDAADLQLQRPQVRVLVELSVPAEGGEKKAIIHEVEIAPTSPQAELEKAKLAFGRLDGAEESFVLQGSKVVALATLLLKPVIPEEEK